MKAALLTGYDQDLEITDVPDPTVTGPLDVIVRIGAAGLCRTDIHIQQGWFADGQREAGLELPYVPGHENAGWVEAVGEAVTNVAVGDAVILHPLQTCGLCRACRAGQDMHCESGAFNGIFVNGGFAQYMKTNARTTIKLAPHLQPSDVAALADAGLTAYHAVKKSLPLLYPGTRALVIGAGGLGHIGIQCLLAMSPAEIIVLDTNQKALDLATQLGAHHVVQTQADGAHLQQVRDLTDGRGADVVIDFVGERGAEKDGAALLRPAGSFFVVGYGGMVAEPLQRMVLEEINFVGNLVGTYNDLAELMVLTAQGKVTLHTQEYALADINKAIADLEAGTLVGRGLLVP